MKAELLPYVQSRSDHGKNKQEPTAMTWPCYFLPVPCCWWVDLAAGSVPVDEVSEPTLQRALCHQVMALGLRCHLTQACKVQWDLPAVSARVGRVTKAMWVSPLVMVTGSLFRKGEAKWERKSPLGNRAGKRGQV